MAVPGETEELKQRFAARVEKMLTQDMGSSTPLTTRLADQPLWIRAGAPLVRLIAPIL